MEDEAILKTIAAAYPGSASDPASQLGIAKEHVVGAVEAWVAQGIPIEGDATLGYRLNPPLPLVSEANVCALLDGAGYSLPVEVRLCVESTSDVLVSKARQGNASPEVLVAELQSKGRGRQGNAWVSPFASNLYFSVLWPTSASPETVAAMTLAVGVTLAEVIEDLTGVSVQLKWPNDLYVRGHKLGGILVDWVSSGGASSAVVIGVGINVLMNQQDSSSAITRPWTDLKRSGARTLNRDVLLGGALTAVLRLLEDYPQRGLAPYLERWAQRDLLRGQHVVFGADEEACGEAVGVDASGALLVATQHGTERVFAGDVRLQYEATQ
jgi:BirA family biotin operon repressor/biotin-[acetyl-CoA-carboxylase] ligase